MPMSRCLPGGLLAAILLVAPDLAHAAAAALDGTRLRWPWALPFVGILLTIATGPLLFPRIWHRHYGKLAFCLEHAHRRAVRRAVRHARRGIAAFVHAMLAEYLSFIVLLFALYVVAGGILVTGNLRGTPLVNTAILAFGTLIASVVGTTGAAMILIRPLFRANAARLNNVHVVVFFIFLVANIGGALSPLGDPPLFVGFLHGVDFFWTTKHSGSDPSWPASCSRSSSCSMLVLPQGSPHHHGRREPTAARPRRQRQASISCSSPASSAPSWRRQPGSRASLRGLRDRRRAAEHRARRCARADRDRCRSCSRPTSTARPTASPGSRSWKWRSCSPAFSPASFRCSPCSRPARTALLLAARRGHRARRQPARVAYFWLTGVLSAFLDNAPTYLVFFELAGGDAGELMGPLAANARGDLHGRGLSWAR